ncbi:hypothetical protein KSC_045100 [Ktedonobacter sp. SOSP1-52]|uniref:hypothetical protein n=1 Tax=Ktedonobacter sp. SOSP1-52 TaxID=2778366 RepID=UPI0019169D30|nr:hypothetical protein [Ktedonobacter sp. SOSP1-52]GHO65618.1 hypothetical protein KSC_045100 [Ktedonobacter sp. SOSP1-52]
MADFLFIEGSDTGVIVVHPVNGPASPAVRGIPLERAHPSLLRLLSVLFPADNGLRFLEDFLRLAHLEPGTPSAEVSEEEGAYAVVRVRNQRELAQLLGVDYDRINRYVLLLQKMRLLTRRDEANGIALSLALGEPRLAHPDALDALASYRPKVGTFALKVKQRWLALLQASDACTIACTPQFEQAIQPEKASSTLHGQMVDLADVEQTAINLYGAAAARRLLEQLTSRTSLRDTSTATEVALSRGESPFEKRQTKGDSSTQNGESPFGIATQKGDSPIPKGDSPATRSPGKWRLACEKIGDFRATSAHAKGDSSPEVVSNLSNVNVTFKEIINIINVNVKEVASYLCHVFGEDAQRQGYYHQLYKQHSNPQAWLGALLETLLAQQRGSVRNPGGYFYKRCAALHKAIPAETERFIAQFSTYTYAQLQEHLRSSGTTSQVNPSSQQPAVPSRPDSLPPAVTLNIPHDSQRPGMKRETLIALYQRIDDDKQGYKLRVFPYQQQDSTGILLLVDSFNRQRWIYTPQEWHEANALLHQSGRLKDIFNIPAA